MSNEVGQFEGPHTKAADCLHGRVDCGGVGHSVFEATKCFEVKGSCHSVDDKAGSIGAAGHLLPPRRGDVCDTIKHRIVGGLAANNFNEFHDRRRIKEVHATGSGRLPDSLAQFRDRE